MSNSDVERELREANRTGINYRAVPDRRSPGPIVDIHTHVHPGACARVFFEAAELYKITHIASMTPLDEVQTLREQFPGRLAFIAIPNWKKFDDKAEHRDQWIADLATFRELGSRICKFWMAPPMRERHGLTVEHEFLRPVVKAAMELGYHFMIHAGDPSVWWREGGKYADTTKFGTKADQYPQVEWLLDFVAPRIVIGAHMGGTVEELPRLQGLLDRHPNYRVDTSATKWIVREVARQPEAVREFVIRNSERVLFGSDLVAAEKFTTFDHYASRYWAHQQMWETGARIESPIHDPDAEDPPRLAGVDLPADVLRRIYHGNALGLGFAG